MMKNYNNITAQPEYDAQFWAEMRIKATDNAVIAKAASDITGGYRFPSTTEKKLSEAIVKESVFRKISTNINAYSGNNHILAKDCDDVAAFIAPGEEIPGADADQDFTPYTVERHKLAVIVKLTSDFVHDASFSIEKYLIERLGKNFGGAEDNGFINGTGVNEPTGILADTGGADVALTTPTLTYDNMLTLYHSTDKRYRNNAVWLMNDDTALHLRKLKDDGGNYLWNTNNDTILGKPVVISEYMPDIEAGSKPVAFGDFSYYWIIDRDPASVQVLKELYLNTGHIGYLAYEFLDGKLIRSDAVKVISIGNSENV